MTPKERAAMRQALEALELAKGSHGVMLMSNPPHDAWAYRGCDSKLSEAITALRESLAEQAEQEPVAKVLEGGYEVLVFDRLPEETPLYAAPVRTKDLTDDEIHKAFYSKNTGLINGIRAVIAADRRKNK